MSKAELERIVDEATLEESQFLFIRLSEKLRDRGRQEPLVSGRV
jgi:hypothetical protein